MNPSGEDLAKIISAAAEAEASPLPQELTADVSPDLGIDLEEHRLQFQINCLNQDLQELKDTHGLRVSYTGRIFWLVVAWLACVVACVVLSGFQLWGFRLPESVLIAFITSTTVNVVGLFVLVAKWMFPSGRDAADGAALHSRAASLQKSKPTEVN